jgi:hypothetical protein
MKLSVKNVMIIVLLVLGQLKMTVALVHKVLTLSVNLV